MATSPQSRFPALAILVGLSGCAALAISTHTKLISTAAAAISAVIWTAFVGLTSKIWGRVEKTDRKSTRLNSSHQIISYAVFCLKKKTNTTTTHLGLPVP